MEHVAALLLLVGCTDGPAECRELPAPTPIYETLEACQAELQPAISRYVTRVPQVYGQCVEVDPAMEEADAELVWDVTASGTLVASIEAVNTMYATDSDSGANALVSQQ